MSDSMRVVGHAFSLSVPVAFDSPNAIRDLCELTRNPDAAIYALRLWDHRQRQAATFRVNDPVGVVERICGWRRKRGELFAALVDTGLVLSGDDGTVTIPGWREVATVEWMGAAGVKPSKRTDANAAERARAWRANAKRTQTERTANGTERRPNADRTQTERSQDAGNPSTYARDTRATGTETSPVASPEEPSTAPTADAAVPAPEGKPEQTSLIALPDKPKSTPRKATPEQQQADAWRAKALGIAGIAEGDAGPWPKGIFHQWRRAAKARGVETLMRSLDGIARMPPTEFARKRGWVHWISGEGIDAGLAALAAPNAPAASRGASNAISGGGSVREWREYDRPPPEPGPDWTPEAALAKLIHRPAFMAHEPPGRFVVPKGKSLGDFDTSRIPPQHLPILDLNVEGS